MTRRILTRSLQVLIDVVVLTVAYALAFLFRFEFQLNELWLKLFVFTLPYVVLFQYVVLALAGVPMVTWRYIGLRDVYRILVGIGGAVAVLFVFRVALASFRGHFFFVRIPFGVLAMDFVLALLGVAGVRVLRRFMAERGERQAIQRGSEPKRTLLVGAGSAGSLVARELAQRPDLGMKLVGFADDDPVKLGTLIQGAKVLGDTHSLRELVLKHQVEQIIITMASAHADVIRRLMAACEEAGLAAKIIPGLYEILDGRVNLSRIREVTIDDLLGRDVVELDIEGLQRFLSGKNVLVTGAGGSIGSELCRQIARLNPSKLLLVEQAENALFEIHRELRSHQDVEVVPLIADVCDRQRIEQIFSEFEPNVVLHAAAHKHVPMMEWNPGEAIKNNVVGTRVVADAAANSQCDAFVMISTDKAVNPTSVMGCSKRVAELYVQSLSQASDTTFVVVRFGNVLGSQGSVIPIFKEQIARGGPVTVTHPEMRRYFMTIPEASQLVLQAGSMGDGGEIFVLDMGTPVKIVDLARDLIRLSGFTETEIPITFTGLRPGEKLFEELSMDSEQATKTKHPKIFIGRIDAQEHDRVVEHLDQLERVARSGQRGDVRRALQEVVPELRPPDDAPVVVSSRPGHQVLH
ncbi:MAG: polysaccharide biosynthesis protein [Myxococcales bacterium]|nr:polysaccharide biosynthesis protein [Myxococcales bacterium]